MDYFGLRSLDELPKLKELVQTDNKIGDDEAMEEEVNPG
jgi:chromosome segregation and condensation protein ScpB